MKSNFLDGSLGAWVTLVIDPNKKTIQQRTYMYFFNILTFLKTNKADYSSTTE